MSRIAASATSLVVLVGLASSYLLSPSFRSSKPTPNMISPQVPPVQYNLDQLRQTVTNFTPNKFYADTWLRRNPHWQTIVGTGAIFGKIFGEPPRPFHVTPRRITTPDNDFFDIEFVEENKDSKDIVIILHGLEGNAKTSAITNSAIACLEKGFSCILYSFRSCSGVPNNNAGAYHVGFTTDLSQLIDLLHEEFPEKNIFLTGTSLGGNVILKYLGEQGEKCWEKRVRGAAVACVPFDPKACQSKLDVGFSRAIYSEVRLYRNIIK
jgi:uncharacterized protein